MSLWNRLRIKGDPLSVYSVLTAHYAESHRSYHNLFHIAHCLDEFHSVCDMAKHPDVIEWAVWFHDVIYDPKSKENEKRSADFAAHVAKEGGLHSGTIKQCKRLILATKHDRLPDEDDSRMLIDVDLSIFGQSEERFMEYERNIRKEYSWVEDDVYRKKRIEVLRGFLERKRIYLTCFFQEKYESAARKNLKASINTLRSVFT